MNPALQKDNELVSHNPTINNRKKLLTDSDEKNAKKNMKDNKGDNTFNDPSIKKDIHSLMSEENKQNMGNSNGPDYAVSDEYISNIKNCLDTANKLELKIAVSTTLEKGQTLEISPLGLTNSLRKNAGDGHVFFGFQTDEEMEENKNTNEIKNKVTALFVHEKSKEAGNKEINPECLLNWKSNLTFDIILKEIQQNFNEKFPFLFII